MNLQIGLLGTTILRHDGRETSVRPNQARTILALLALSCGRVVSTEQLIDELWADRPLGNARNALQANVARLRRLLASLVGLDADLVRAEANGYLLDLQPDAVDAKRFDDLARAGSACLLTDPARAAGLFEAALQQWRGMPLLDVAGGHTCRAVTVRLSERRLDVRKQLAEANLVRGATHGLISEIKQLVAEHPSDEQLSELLMLALYRSGRQSEALAVFHNIRSWLGAEFGLEPGPRLHQVQHAILNQDRSFAALRPSPVS
ncbi:AfsR/SARP family transcriptional regulator [Micromonospora sp. NPDC049044]|uniref:AfsR/SARP family transcriptional regulator n=1 Tax=unclassified Micromonospora TaxID=2617518 RepID=UPI0033CB53CE